MAKEVYYRQCQLVRGATHQITWLPERYAVVGRYVKLKEGDVWDDGWQVTSVGDQRQEESFVNARSQDYKNMKKMTDI